MSIYKTIKEKITKDLNPEHLEIIDESHKHLGNRKESHFKLIIVSEFFKDVSLVKRHQMLYQLLDLEIKQKIHALSLKIYTPEEWSAEESVLDSPDCSNKK